MNPLRHCKNLLDQDMAEGLPWNFTPTIDLEPLRVKKTRVDSYNTIEHNFYTGFFGTVPSVRTSKENVPQGAVAAVLDLDSKIDPDILLSSLALVPKPFVPRFLEFTLSSHWRTVLPFETPLVWGCDNTAPLWKAFLEEFLKESKTLELFPSLDKPAFMDPTRMYFNHCNWMELDGKDGLFLPRSTMMKLATKAFDAVSGKVRLASGKLSNIEEAAKALSERYPKFKEQWSPSDFQLGSVGTSFWVEESKSLKSAVVKEEGMFTWSAHADRRFYTWNSLLGAGFVEKDHENRDAFLLDTFYFNDAESKYYKFLDHTHSWLALNETHLKHELMELGVSHRLDPDGAVLSETDQWSKRIRNMNNVKGLGPFMFESERKVCLEGSSYLNSFSLCRPIQAAGTFSPWGPKGKFPNLSRLLESRFSTGTMDLTVLLSYLKVIYQGVLQRKKQVKQGLIMVGKAQTGKTWINTGLIPGLVGSMGEGSKYLTGGTQFTADIFNHPHIAVDDAEMSADAATHRKYSERLKSLVSKANIMVEEKFKTAGKGLWYGSTGITANSDFGSMMSALPDLTLSISDKLIIIQFAELAVRESEPELKAIMRLELPHFARWLLEFEIPVELLDVGRYELVPWKSTTVLEEFEQHSDYYLAAQIVTRAAVRYFRCEDNKQLEIFEGDHLALYEMINEMSPSLGREWSQKRIIAKLRETISNVKGCDWVTYDHKTSNWTIFKKNLPVLRTA